MTKSFNYVVLSVVSVLLGCATEGNRGDLLSTSRHAAISPQSCMAAAMANPTADDENNYRIQPNDVDEPVDFGTFRGSREPDPWQPGKLCLVALRHTLAVGAELWEPRELNQPQSG